MAQSAVFIFFILSFCCHVNSAQAKPPHIILIVADDLGWNDVSFHGSNQIPTPNIDALAYSGIILQNYYVDPICTPSRSALMSGRHPIHTGLQDNVLVGAAPYSLSPDITILPQHLNTRGYHSHAVGKWHLGSHTRSVTPTHRGFLSHTGYWTGHEDYYDHTAQELYRPVAGWGYDFRRNMSVAWEDYGDYATDIFTSEAEKIISSHSTDSPLFLYLAHLAVHSANTYSPLQAPQEAIDRHSYIKDINRRKFSGMLYKLDESVGKVVAALERKKMLQDSIIVFTTDNGGPAAGFDINHASNWPLRGVKDTLWEGGVRGASWVWSPRLKSAPRVSSQMMNIQDWLPTLLTAAGATSLPEDIDGLDQWSALSRDTSPPRNVMLHNIDDRRLISALRVGDWKLLKGTSYGGSWDGWYGPAGREEGTYSLDMVRHSQAARVLESVGLPLPEDEVILRLRQEADVSCRYNNSANTCDPRQEVCLFKVTEDPCEQNNLVFKYPDIVKTLEETLRLFNSTAVAPRNKPIDPRADPKYYDYVWTNWCDIVEGGCPDTVEFNRVDTANILWDRQVQAMVNRKFDIDTLGRD